MTGADRPGELHTQFNNHELSTLQEARELEARRNLPGEMWTPYNTHELSTLREARELEARRTSRLGS